MNKYGLNITREYIHSQPAYLEHQKKIKSKKEFDNEITEEQTFELSEKQIKDWFEKQNSDLSETLIAKLRKTDPYQFEEMMVKLLNAMGYKGTNGQSVVTQKSNDGEMLTNLMIQYKVGVQVSQTYELYDIDDDFFEQ